MVKAATKVASFCEQRKSEENAEHPYQLISYEHATPIYFARREPYSASTRKKVTQQADKYAHSLKYILFHTRNLLPYVWDMRFWQVTTYTKKKSETNNGEKKKQYK